MPEAFDLDDGSTAEPKPIQPSTPAPPSAKAGDRPPAPQAKPPSPVSPATIAPTQQSKPTGVPPAAGNRASDLLRGHPNYKQSVEKDVAPRQPLIAQDRRVTRFDDFATGIFWFAFGIAVLCLLYFLFGIFSGSLSKESLKGVDVTRITANLQLTSTIMSVSAIVATLMMVFLFYDESFAAYSLVGFAVFLQVILPLIVSQYFDMSKSHGSLESDLVLSLTKGIAVIPGVPGFILLGWELVRQFVGKLETAKVAKANLQYGKGMVFKQPKIRNQFLGPCWNTPYCRDNIRSKCPIYIGRKKGPCWRNKRGCMCDETIVLNATAGNWKDTVTSTVSKLDGGLGKTIAHTTSAPPPTQQLSMAFKKERCRQCVIYNTHQEQKYKALVALTFTAGLAAVVLLSSTLVDFVKSGYDWLDTTLGRFSFNGSTGPVASPAGNGIALGDPVAWVILVLVSIIVLSKVLQLVEYCCFKIKI